MTYKDHGELARLFKRHLENATVFTFDEPIHEALTDLLEDIADYCERDNPRFDRDRFMIGTGIGIV